MTLLDIQKARKRVGTNSDMGFVGLCDVCEGRGGEGRRRAAGRWMPFEEAKHMTQRN